MSPKLKSSAIGARGDPKKDKASEQEVNGQNQFEVQIKTSARNQSQCAKSSMQTSSQGSPSLSERKQPHKDFLRQVYTNMQKTGRRNRHYEQYSRRLKVELTNSYVRRKVESNEHYW